ncbi:MAG: DNA (cytosine-5-)-methyltransferase [Candidatus Pacebacteria bacterium]|nr:DNA (cytosine-5-)-methyltransferase [Candidatus Paceibacterota bacterium]MBP9780393.1 DNA (cytosine-5-)-methyltransferase [Candidatus Paceibacterota bacterium]
MKKIKVVELFAGVGGFRIGLDRASKKDMQFETVWSSQWEPGAITQHASEIYKARFGTENHSCEDIQEVIEKNFKEIPNHDLLVGGFPCQDYSVARTANQAKGIFGKKGVLWWSIHKILEKKGKDSPNFLMLENVDRLLKSPSAQRGRDFAVMLASLSDLGYAVEWRVVNAADYGFPQRRRRVFILGYKKGSKIYNEIKIENDKKNWIFKKGVLVKAFPLTKEIGILKDFDLKGELQEISVEFSKSGPSKSPFEVSGIMFDRHVYTVKTTPEHHDKKVVLNDLIISSEKEIPREYYIDPGDLKRWHYLKGGKKEGRKSKDGFEYEYAEGPMVFPDPLDKPSRTIVTGEGGTSPSRFKHVIKTKSGKLRRLTPVELERLNMFPDNHTKFMHNGKITPDNKRAFIMGNALVVGVIERIGKALLKQI